MLIFRSLRVLLPMLGLRSIPCRSIPCGSGPEPPLCQGTWAGHWSELWHEGFFNWVLLRLREHWIASLPGAGLPLSIPSSCLPLSGFSREEVGGPAAPGVRANSETGRNEKMGLLIGQGRTRRLGNPGSLPATCIPKAGLTA